MGYNDKIYGNQDAKNDLVTKGEREEQNALKELKKFVW